MNPNLIVDGECHSHRSSVNHSTWGDPIKSKKKECIRIIFQNINGFGYKKEDETKTLGFYDLMSSTDSDIYCMAETNVDWRKVTKKKTIWEQTKRLVREHFGVCSI